VLETNGYFVVAAEVQYDGQGVDVEGTAGRYSNEGDYDEPEGPQVAGER